MKIFYNAQTDRNLRDFGIQVPLEKSRSTEVIRRMEEAGLSKWIKQLSHEAYTLEEVQLVHSASYCQKIRDNPDEVIKVAYELVDKNGCYVRYKPQEQVTPFEKLVEIHLTQAKGTYYAALEAMESNQPVFHLGGGMHHAMSFGGRGFCLINDLVLAAVKLKQENKLQTCWIVDVDAHKGDGSAELAQQLDWLTTLSIHMAKGWPLDGIDEGADAPWLIPSTLDIEVYSGEEKSYLKKLKVGLDFLLQKQGKPELILVALGADPWEFDELPSASLLKLTTEQMLERDQLIYNFAQSVKVPIVFTMAGGYGKRTWEPYWQFISWANSPAAS